MMYLKTVQDEIHEAPIQRKGNWLQTYSGNTFWPLDPIADEVDIFDIAHSLSMQCRFAGHCENFYSVAEHCCWIADSLSPENKLWGLLHDASEAYLVDVPRPVKYSLVGYKEIETNLMKVICEKFGLPEEMPKEVHEADNLILNNEMQQNMKTPPIKWDTDNGQKLDVKLKFWNPKIAEQQFLSRFNSIVKSQAKKEEVHAD